jgi:DNA-binding NarL/FixJ family response regulator
MSVSSELQSKPACRVVLVDAREERRQRMRHALVGDDATAVLVGEADSKDAALAVVDDQRADVVVLDVQMPLSEGLATIAALRERYPRLGIVVCSFDLDRTTVEQVLAHGADRCLAKPVRREDDPAALAGLRYDDRPGEGAPGPLTVPCEAPATC